MTAKTINCENCMNFRGFTGEITKPFCKLGKRIMYRVDRFPGIKNHPGYRRKCNDYKQKEEQLPVDEHGRDFLGMPVVGNRELLIPVKEIRLFAEYVLKEMGSTLPKFRLAELYGKYVCEVIKPKYEKK